LLQLVAHRTVSHALAGALRELAALGNSRRSSTKNHQTVRCASGLYGEPSVQRSIAGLRPQSEASELRRQSPTTGPTELSGAPKGQKCSMISSSKPQRSTDVARTRQ
jgi:hypothetical protein